MKTKTKKLLGLLTAFAVALSLVPLLPNVVRSSGEPTFTVTFESNGGSAVASIGGIFPGSGIVNPGNPTKIGHVFRGWFTDDGTFADEFIFADLYTTTPGIPVEDILTLYAKWEALEEFTLSYIDNNGIYGTGTAPVGGTYYEGEAVEVAGPGDLAFDDYVFAGWSTDELVDDEVEYYPGQNITITKDTVLYAVWIVDFTAVPVTGVGIVDTNFELGVGETKDLTVTFTPDNATNKGINWTSDDETVATVSGGRVTAVGVGAAVITAASIEGDKAAYVIVNVNEAFIPVNQIVGVDTSNLPTGKTRDLSAVACIYPYDATNFANPLTWAIVETTPASGVATITPEGVLTATGGGTVLVMALIENGATAVVDFVQLFEITVDPPHTVTFSLNYIVGTNPVETFDVSVVDGETLGAKFPTAPTRNGFTFRGWVIANGFPGAGDPFTEDTIVTDDIRVAATWDAIAYNITYDLGGGGLAPGDTNPAVYSITSSALTLINPTRAGFTFAGWLGTGLTTPTMSVTIPQGSFGDRNYAAYWAVDTYTLTLDYDYDGKTETIENINHGTSMTLPTLSRPGYTFNGWYVNTTTTGSSFWMTILVDETQTLYARWTEKPTTGITLNKSSTVININAAELLTVIYDPSDTLDRQVTWSSDNPAVATIIENVGVFGHSEGTATITARLDSNGSIYAECTVTVVNPESHKVEPTGVTINEGNLDLDIGETSTLTATVDPSDSTYQAVSWSSSDTSVATVDAYGIVTAVGAGEATITSVVNPPGVYADVNHSITVTVTAAAPFVPVTTITGVNTNNMGKGGTRNLNIGATVYPSTATNKTIQWLIQDIGTTGATINAITGVLITPNAGTVTVRALISGGTNGGSGMYTQDFTILVTESPALVTITFDPNFNQHHAGTGTQSFTQSQVIAGATLTQADFPTTTRDETATHTYTFLGYASSASPGIQVITTFSTVNDRTLYVQWRADCKHAVGYDYISNNDATCTADGTETGDCSTCGEVSDTRTAVGSKLSHTPKAANCTECSACTTTGLDRTCTTGSPCTFHTSSQTDPDNTDPDNGGGSSNNNPINSGRRPSSTTNTTTASNENESVTGTEEIIIDVPVTVIQEIAGNLPTTQIAATSAGNQTVTTSRANAGKNAVLLRYNSETGKFEVVSAATVGADGTATVNIPGAGDYIVVVAQTGDLTGTGTVTAADALLLLQALTGNVELNPLQAFLASSRGDSKFTATDALNILKLVSGMIDEI